MILISKSLLVDAFNVNDAVIADLRKLGVLETGHYVEWGDGVSSGAVDIEGAPDPSYAGTWAPIETVTFAPTAPKTIYVRVAGAHGAIRHRVSTVVTDGTVSTKIVGS